jgi:hypothetical protein
MDWLMTVAGRFRGEAGFRVFACCTVDVYAMEIGILCLITASICGTEEMLMTPSTKST